MARVCSVRWRHRLSARVMCNAERQPIRTIRSAPDPRTPKGPPPPPMPPPPPEDDDEMEPKIFGIKRRRLFPFLVGVPLGLIYRQFRKSEMIEEEVIASVMVPRKTKNGIKKFRKDIKYVMGKNKMLYRVAQDEKGRTFMVDANGVLFYDSGIKKVGWYAVEPGGEITNFYADGGKVRYKALGNISNLRVFKINEFMGLEIDPIKIAAFSDEELKPLPPNTPLVKSAKSGNLVPPLYIDEEMEGESLDEKMIEEMIKGEEETAPRVMGPIEILAQLESDMESLLNAVDGQSIANESAAQFDDHVQQLKEQLAVKRQDPASVLRQEIEILRKQVNQKDALLLKYGKFVGEWQTKLDSLKAMHSVNVHDFRKRPE